jgi:O-antigen/teichoic acid export membrane protein
MGQVKRRLLINASFGGMSYVVSMLVSIILTPFLLGRLGAELYGLIPLVNSMVIFLSLLSMGIYAALGRHVTLHHARGEFDEANTYLNTGLGLLTGLGALGLGVLLVLVLVLPRLFSLPTGHEADAQIVALIMGLNCLVTIMASPIGVPLYCTQRLAIRYGLDIGDVLIRSTLIVLAFVCIRAHVIYVALATLVSTLTIQTAHYILARKLVPELRFTLSAFSRKHIRPLASFSIFMMIGQVGVLLTSHMSMLLVNWLFGMTTVTFYSLALRWRVTVGAILWTMVAVVTPTITALEARGRMGKVREAAQRGTRYCLLLCILPAVLFPLFGREFYVTWTRQELYGGCAPFLTILMLPLLVFAAGCPMNVILRGLGRVKFIAFVTLGSSLFYIGCALALSTVGGLGLTGIPLAAAITTVLTYLVVYPAYACRLLDIEVMTYLRSFIRPVLAALPMVALALWIRQNFNLVGWRNLLTAYAVCSLVYLAAALVLGLTADDRKMLRQTLLKTGLGRSDEAP